MADEQNQPTASDDRQASSKDLSTEQTNKPARPGGKAQFLHREEIRSMEKDVMQTREQEVEKERERIALIQQQQQTKREKQISEQIRMRAQQQQTQQKQQYSHSQPVKHL